MALIASASKDNGGTTAAIDTTGATLLVIVLSNLNTTPSITDSKGNTWTALTRKDGTSSRNGQIFYAGNGAIVGTGHTFTLSGASGAASFAVAAFSETLTASVFDAEAAGGDASSPTTTVQTGSLTPGVAANLLIAGLAGDAYTSFSIDSGFTIAVSLGKVGFDHQGVAIAYLAQSSATAQNPTWTVSTNDASIIAVMASFKASGGGGGGPVAARRSTALPLLGVQ